MGCVGCAGRRKEGDSGCRIPQSAKDRGNYETARSEAECRTAKADGEKPGRDAFFLDLELEAERLFWFLRIAP